MTRLNWDSAARRYVEHDTAAQPVANDNLPVAEQPAGHAGGLQVDMSAIGAVMRGKFKMSDGTTFELVDGGMVITESGPFISSIFQDRRGSFMQTYGGRHFWPLDARASEIDVIDIAHALSMQCRYAGHCLNFYSVAEHSVHIARWLLENYGRDVALAGLLHDATEAYLVDLPRPVKRDMPDYKMAEDRLWTVVAKRFGLPEVMPDEVHEADTRILSDEVRQNMRPMDWQDNHNDPLGVTLQFWQPEVAKAQFMLMFYELTGEATTPWSAEDQADWDYQAGKEAA